MVPRPLPNNSTRQSRSTPTPCWNCPSSRAELTDSRDKSLVFGTAVGTCLDVPELYNASSSTLFSIFVPPTTNALREILLARTITGESPVKKHIASKDSLETVSATSEKRKGKNNPKNGSSSSRPPTRKSETLKRTAALSDTHATRATQDGEEHSGLPVAGLYLSAITGFPVFITHI